jgi:hypothetical protein
MTEDEQREILEQIARDEDNYPRDRIAAVRACVNWGTGWRRLTTCSTASSRRRRSQADFCFHAKAEVQMNWVSSPAHSVVIHPSLLKNPDVGRSLRA